MRLTVYLNVPWSFTWRSRDVTDFGPFAFFVLGETDDAISAEVGHE
jgi:hypothetical protein